MYQYQLLVFDTLRGVKNYIWKTFKGEEHMNDFRSFVIHTGLFLW